MARVLIVDDEPGIREFLSEALGDDDHDILAVDSGEAGNTAGDVVYIDANNNGSRDTNEQSFTTQTNGFEF